MLTLRVRHGYQRRDPVEEIPGRRIHVAVAARPDRDRKQHDVPGGESRHGEAAQQLAIGRLRAFVQ